MTSVSPQSALGEDPDAQTLNAIQTIMRKDPRRMTLAGRHTKGIDLLPDIDLPKDTPARKGSLSQSVRGYRPTRRHIVWAGLAVLVVLRPWWVFGPLLLAVLVFVGFMVTLGPERFWDKVQAGLEWYARRAPDRAAKLMRKLDRIAERWDGILDRLPERWAEKLSLPCFEDRYALAMAHEQRIANRLDRIEGED